MKKILISVIIANFNGERYLDKCLNSVFAEKNKSYEVIVIDDASEDKSLEILKKFKNRNNYHLIVLKNNIGTGNAINLGAKKSQGKYLFFLNNDAYIKNAWYEEIVDFFRKFKKAAIGQAKILKVGTNNFDYAGDYISPFGFLIERAKGAHDKGQFYRFDKIFAVKGTAMFVKKSIFNNLSGFDKDYKFAVEETDLCWRSWLTGYEVYFVPTITAYHAFGTPEKVTVEYYHKKGDILFQGCKNTVSSVIKNLELKNLVKILPIHAGCWFVLSILFFIKFQPSRGLALQKGILWNIFNFRRTMKKRYIIQKNRKITDAELFQTVGSTRNIFYYLAKALTYVTGKQF